MEKVAKKGRQVVATGILSVGSLISTFSKKRVTNFGEKSISQQYKVSNGVFFQQECYKNGRIKRSVNMIHVDLTDDYTKLLLNIPSPLNELKTTSSQVLENHVQNQVVGAINASFFETEKEVAGLPASLVLENGSLIRFGRNSRDENGFNFYNQAFGILKNGRAKISEHRPEIQLNYKSDQHRIFSIDANDRIKNEIVMYTPQHYLKKVAEKPSVTSTELVVETNTTNIKNLKFGTIIKGVVTKRYNYGEKVNTTIPSNGIVLSASGKEWANKLSNISVGDQISISLNIDKDWREAKYVIGAGPYLVKNGKRHITMNTLSSLAITPRARTAIGVSENGKKVFIVTVDQNNFSHGMSMVELADYMISIGCDHAINLDGGGSTTMLLRQRGDSKPRLINTPTSGEERKVSTTLQIIDTSPNAINNEI